MDLRVLGGPSYASKMSFLGIADLAGSRGRTAVVLTQWSSRRVLTKMMAEWVLEELLCLSTARQTEGLDEARGQRKVTSCHRIPSLFTVVGGRPPSETSLSTTLNATPGSPQASTRNAIALDRSEGVGAGWDTQRGGVICVETLSGSTDRDARACRRSS